MRQQSVGHETEGTSDGVPRLEWMQFCPGIGYRKTDDKRYVLLGMKKQLDWLHCIHFRHERRAST